MKLYRSLVFCAALFACFSTHAEVGDTDVIDIVASKPELKRVSLVLFQARPWDDESSGLFDKKVQFYSFAISSKALVQQDPSLKDKPFRIIVIYQEAPPATIAGHLDELKASFAKNDVDFVWGGQDDLLDLAKKP